MIDSITEPPSIGLQIGSEDLVQTIIVDTSTPAPSSTKVIDDDEVRVIRGVHISGPSSMAVSEDHQPIETNQTRKSLLVVIGFFLLNPQL